MIDILAHRGIWDKNIEPNSLGALSNSIKSGFGIETDLRDHEGRIVISHDMPRTPVLLFEDFLDEYCQLIKPSNNQQYLALNIKSDGLQFEIKRILSEFKIDKYFVFDMSIPDTFPYIKNNLNIFLRHSDYEEPSKNFNQYDGIWIDHFERDMFSPKDLDLYLSNEKKICFVSPELHNREYIKYWEMIKRYVNKTKIANKKNIMICTDKTQEALEFFK